MREEHKKSGRNVKTTGSDGDKGSTKTGRTRRRSVVRAAAVCTHVDDGFLEQLTRLYRQRTTPEFKCLDLCASHVSHYPYAYAYVLGHGLNREELERNEQFRRGMNAFFVRNFNEHPVVARIGRSIWYRCASRFSTCKEARNSFERFFEC